MVIFKSLLLNINLQRSSLPMKGFLHSVSIFERTSSSMRSFNLGLVFCIYIVTSIHYKHLFDTIYFYPFFSFLYQPEEKKPMKLVLLISVKSLGSPTHNKCSVNTVVISMEINYRFPVVREHPRADGKPDSIHCFRFQNGTGYTIGDA